MLEKSLLVRDIPKPNRKVQVRSVDIRKAIKEDKTIPDVALHKMDTISK